MAAVVVVAGDCRGRLLWRMRACDCDGLEGRLVENLWVEDVGIGGKSRVKVLRLVRLDMMLLMLLWVSLGLMS